MKFRFPKVPPGARLRLTYSGSSPYAWSNAVTAPATTAVASPVVSARSWPASASARATQNIVTPLAVIASARVASHQFSANSAETMLRRTNATRNVSMRASAGRGRRASAISPVMPAVA